jgi:hypothetical protein|tara:strand:- start:862 stop:1137 length:276 start_codon:yes stop_codon:yes gene_type:complete
MGAFERTADLKTGKQKIARDLPEVPNRGSNKPKDTIRPIDWAKQGGGTRIIKMGRVRAAIGPNTIRFEGNAADPKPRRAGKTRKSKKRRKA